MKCFHIALLLPLVLTGRTPGVLAANDCPVVVGEQGVLMSMAWPKALRRTSVFQSRIGLDADQLTANVFSPYDMYYANGGYRANQAGSRPSDDGSQVNDSAADEAMRAKMHDVLTVAARLGRYAEHYASQVAAYGKAAVVYASQRWTQAAAFVHEREKNGAESGLAHRDRRDRVAQRNRAGLGMAPPSEPVEYLYITSREPNQGAILATLSKAVVEYRLRPSQYATLLGEFCQVDDQLFATVTPTADFAMPWGPNVEDVEVEIKRDRNVKGSGSGLAQTKTGAFPQTKIGTVPWAVPLEQLAKWWLGDWDVVFRDISRQIAGLDWTVVLTGRPSHLAVHGTAQASKPVER